MAASLGSQKAQAAEWLNERKRSAVKAMLDQSLEAQLQALVAAAAGIPGVIAITLGGSAASGLADDASDVDLHVYWRAPLAEPQERADQLAPIADTGSVEVEIMDWGREDHLKIGGRKVELVYLAFDELLDQAERAYGEGLGAEGYATAFLYSVAQGRLLHDAVGELGRLRARLGVYPEATRRRLLASHPMLLRTYLGYLKLGQARGDLLSVQHQRYTIQMVFFNVLFALNRLYHPGEKRLLIHAQRCATQPPDLAARWMHSTQLAADDLLLAEVLGDLVNDMCALIEEIR